MDAKPILILAGLEGFDWKDGGRKGGRMPQSSNLPTFAFLSHYPLYA